MKKIYEGVIKYDDYREGSCILFVGDVPLAAAISEDIEDFGNYLSVSYFICDKIKTQEQAKEDFIRYLYGISEAMCIGVYSDMTGYLYTNEKLIVGGHDLITELDSYEGKYLILEIEYNNEPKS